MNRAAALVLGVVLIILGAVWTAQGLGWLGHGGMTGVTFWAIVGPVVVLVGIWLLVRSRRAIHR